MSLLLAQEPSVTASWCPDLMDIKQPTWPFVKAVWTDDVYVNKGVVLLSPIETTCNQICSFSIRNKFFNQDVVGIAPPRFVAYPDLGGKTRRLQSAVSQGDLSPLPTVKRQPGTTDLFERRRLQSRPGINAAPDVLAAPIHFVVYPWVEDLNVLRPRQSNANITMCEWWPPLIQTNKLLPGGGYKPSSIFEQLREDYDFANRVELTIAAIDDELTSLERSGDVLEGESEADEPVSISKEYNFEPDIDYGMQLLITNFLLRAEKQKIQILGSDAFLTSETARVNGHLVYGGTNAWILKVPHYERVGVAREAVAMGFKLISFNDTSLSFIYTP
jgi:hypothetical protein